MWALSRTAWMSVCNSPCITRESLRIAWMSFCMTRIVSCIAWMSSCVVRMSFCMTPTFSCIAWMSACIMRMSARITWRSALVANSPVASSQTSTKAPAWVSENPAVLSNRATLSVSNGVAAIAPLSGIRASGPL